MLPRNVLAKIHIAKKELALTDDAYRDMLRLHFGVESSRDLNPRQGAALLNKLRAKGWKPSGGRKAETGGQKTRHGFIAIKPGPAAAQQRKVLAMWAQLGYEPEKLHTRCRTQFGIDRFEWVTEYEHLHVLITDLERRIKRMLEAGDEL